MKARMPAGFGRPDMNALMRQAQKMQDDMKAKQAELEAAEYTEHLIRHPGRALAADSRKLAELFDQLFQRGCIITHDDPSCRIRGPECSGRRSACPLHKLEQLGLDVSIEDSAKKKR